MARLIEDEEGISRLVNDLKRVAVLGIKTQAQRHQPAFSVPEYIQRVGIEVVPVTNTVFGERVNVSGLLCGADYVRSLRGYAPDAFVLPRPSLDYFGQKFLDSMTIEEVEQAVGAPLTFATQWSEVVRILRDGPRRPGRNAAPNGAFWSEAQATGAPSQAETRACAQVS